MTTPTVKHGVEQGGLVREGAMRFLLQFWTLVILARVEQILKMM